MPSRTKTITRTVFLLSVVAGSALGLLGFGCSEKEPAPVTDHQAPRVEILYPETYSRFEYLVRDSVDIVVEVRDNGAIDSVQIWCAYVTDSMATKLATLLAPDSGYVYKYHWITTGFIETGSRGQMYAVAIDAAGNKGISQKVRFAVINTKEIGPPLAVATVTPPEATVDDIFVFDALRSQDPIDDPSVMWAVWDFNGDGQVDAEGMGYEKMEYKYDWPGRYYAVLALYNTYFDKPGYDTVSVMVLPSGGRPHPPHDDYLLLPPGDYALGLPECDGPFDYNEMTPTQLYTHNTSEMMIERLEVSQGLYAQFLTEAVRAEPPAIWIDPIHYDIFWIDGDEEHYITTSPSYELGFLIFWDPSRQMFYPFPPSTADLPVRGISWYGARAYCAFYNLHLPTEAQWEAAARGALSDTTLIYPWGSAEDLEYRNIDPTRAWYTVDASAPREGPLPVGSFPEFASWLGTLDQAGNVAEWLDDWYERDLYEILYQEFISTGVAPADPTGPDEGDWKVVRGGSFLDEAPYLRVTDRSGRDPSRPYRDVGFRTIYMVVPE